MKTLDRLKLTDKTLVVFCSDNGPVLDDGYVDGAIEKIGKHRAGGPFTEESTASMKEAPVPRLLHAGPRVLNRGSAMKWYVPLTFQAASLL